MRFMLLMKGDPPADAGEGGDASGWDESFVAELVGAMRRYDDELRRAGILLAEGGLYPSAMGHRVVFNGDGKPPRVVDGPFAEAKELIAGYYLIEVGSREEAIEWAKRCPIEKALGPGQEGELEIRQVADIPGDASEGDHVDRVRETLKVS